MEGVVAVFSAADIHPHLAQGLPSSGYSSAFEEARKPVRYPLAEAKVHYQGEAVAVVVAENGYIGADALAQVLVDYDPLPPVPDAQSALAEGAPLIHEQWDSNLAFRWRKSSGNVETAFAEADVIIELPVVNQRLIGSPLEPRSVLASYEAATDSFTVWSTTQNPHSVRDDLAKVLGVEPVSIRLIAPDVGGGFGIKVGLHGEEVLASFIARALGRPVRWVPSRSEDFLASHHGRGQSNRLRLAADAEAGITALELETTYEMGAYFRFSPYIPTISANMSPGTYHIPNFRAVVEGVFVNKLSTEAYRGAGRPEATYMIERAIDLLADELGLDPADVRRRNFIPPSDFPYSSPTGLTYDSGEYKKALDKALEQAGYLSLLTEQARRRRNGGRWLGIGMACYVEICGFGPWEAGGVFMDKHGDVTVLSGTSPQGQGHATTWAQIAAEVLQVPLEKITVRQGDTAVVPRGLGTMGSRSTAVGGSAVFDNGGKVVAQARQIAAHIFEAAAEDIILANGRFQVIGSPQASLSWEEIARAAHSDLLPEGLRGGLKSDVDFEPQGETFPFGAHVCVVEVDPQTGAVEIARYISVEDCGRVINPTLVEGQVHGGIAQGIGQALFEVATYDEQGMLLSGTLMDYALPKALDMPTYETHRTETPTPLNPLGAKGIGEAATIGATPAVVNAVIDALSHLGVRHIDMPLTAEKIWQVIQSSQGMSSGAG
jgi:carbon-monoxide dehydrogenase large subunit